MKIMSRITATVLIDMNHNYDLNFRTGIMCGIISRWFVKGCFMSTLHHPYNYWDDDLLHRWHPNDDVVIMVLIHIASYHDSKNDPMCSKNIRIMILHMMTCVDIAVWQSCVMIHSWQLIITWIIPYDSMDWIPVTIRIPCDYSYSQYWTGTSLQWRLMQGIYLTIIPRTRMGSEYIIHEAEGRMGFWLSDGCLQNEDRRPKTEDRRPKSAKTRFSTPKT